MGPPSPVRHTIPRSSDVFESPLKRRKTNELDPFPSFSNFKHQDDAQSLPALSPALSWLNLHSPSQQLPRPSSTNTGLTPGSAFDFGLPTGPLSDFLYDQLGIPSLSPNAIKPFTAALENFPSTPSYNPSPFSPSLHRPPSPAKNDPLAQKRTWTSPTLREAILMRYFTDHLAHWFDLCDTERHFALVVPQRARHSPPLLNAIFTASARHLTRLPQYKVQTTIDGVEREVIAYAGNILPDLKPETAIQYHNESIKDLIQLSMDPDQVHNEDLLAAAIILRFYEEVDLPVRAKDESDPAGEDDVVDSELFLKVTNIFLNAQQPATPQLPHTSPIALAAYNVLGGRNDSLDSTGYPVLNQSPSSLAASPSALSHHKANSMSDPTPRVPRADGLRQASFWVAFRQEITVAFLKQRPFNFPLSRCSAFRTFSPAEDAVWADRLIIFCADVLQFCHGGGESDSTTETVISEGKDTSRRGKDREKERWDELKQCEKTWSTVLPKSFEPIYFREPDRALNEVFPEIWYLADCHVAGIQHVELARILLAASNPHLPKLGPGHVAAMNQLSAELKSVVLRLCGIALSNRRTPPGLVTACMGIAMCGEHFAERVQQEALMGVLRELEREHAWPTGRTVGMLKKAWGWT